MGLAYRFRGLVHYHYGKKHSGAQADMVLENEPRVLYLDRQAAGRESYWTWFEHLKHQSPSAVIQFLQ